MMGSGLSFPDALFEAVSAATTTGLSTEKRPEGMPQVFLFARTWMQWYGGLGIVVFSLALLFRPGTAAKRIAFTEDMAEDLVGGTKAHAHRVLVVYTILTGAGILLLWVEGVGFFNGLLYTMASVSTGGFAPHATSLAALEGPVVHFSVILICLAGAVPLSFYSRLYKGGRFGRLHSEGPAMIIIERKLQQLMKIVDRIIVLNYGVIIADGNPEAVVHDNEVIESYLGEGGL